MGMVMGMGMGMGMGMPDGYVDNCYAVTHIPTGAIINCFYNFV